MYLLKIYSTSTTTTYIGEWKFTLSFCSNVKIFKNIYIYPLFKFSDLTDFFPEMVYVQKNVLLIFNIIKEYLFLIII